MKNQPSMTWEELLEWARSVDERDLPDASRHWATDDSERSPMPVNKGEWQASIQMAFAAGMRWQEKAKREGTLSLVEDEVQRSRQKFPGNEHMLAALVEEVGEVARALLESKPDEVVAEAVQVAATAVRIAEEGDADFAPKKSAG